MDSDDSEGMRILDDAGELARRDPGGMTAAAMDVPRQLREAWDIAEDVSFPENLAGARCIVAAGLGGSAIGGDLVRELTATDRTVPMVVVRQYDLPAFVGRDSLVFVSSYSGNTEETLSAYEAARAREARIVCITSGGRLAEAARADGTPLVSIPKGLPPRNAVGYMFVPMLALLARFGYAADCSEDIGEASQILQDLAAVLGPDCPCAMNQAKTIALSMHRRIPLVYGAEGLTSVAALRWKTQINENAKTHAFWNAFPEVNHNETVGWGAEEALSRVLHVVVLRDKGDHPRVKRRMDITAGLMTKASGLSEVHSLGRSRMARLLSLVYVGDFASLYLAFLYGVDPKPVELIDYLKKELAATGTGRAG